MMDYECDFGLRTFLWRFLVFVTDTDGSSVFITVAPGVQRFVTLLTILR
jgi:hypothetical protein